MTDLQRIREAAAPLTLAGGAALLVWLGERITLHGVGNGFWLLVITPTLAAGVSNAAGTWELLRMGAVRPEALFAALGFVAVATALIVKTSKANGASTENRVSGADFAGVWPPLLATYVSVFVIRISGLEASVATQLALLAALIVLFNGLQWLGTAPAARRPLWAIALIQIVICVGADLLTRTIQLPFPIDGAWLIVIATTAMSCVRALGPLPETPRTRSAV